MHEVNENWKMSFSGHCLHMHIFLGFFRSVPCPQKYSAQIVGHPYIALLSRVNGPFSTPFY